MAALNPQIACVLLAAAALPVTAATLGTPGECDDLSGIAAFTQFRYTQFQSIFDALQNPKDPLSGLCSSCHPGEVGAGGLGLGDGVSYANLINVPSAQSNLILRVQPGSPIDSLLFQKINCNFPEIGGRMPSGGPNLSTTQQRLFSDWISFGAPLSRLGFEDR